MLTVSPLRMALRRDVRPILSTLRACPQYPLRFNSSRTTPTVDHVKTEVLKDSAVKANRKGIIARISSNLSLTPVGETHSTGGEQGSSSVLKLLELARPEKKQLLQAVGLLIDFFSTNSSTFLGLSFPVAAGLLAATFCVGAACNAGRAIIMRTSGQRIIARVRNQAYLSTLRQEPEFADRSAGDIVSRLSVDTNILGDSVTSNLALISATVGVAAMFWISAKLTLVMLCVVPPVSLGAVFYGRYLRKLSNMTQEAVGDMSKVGAPWTTLADPQTAEEKLNAFKTVAAYNSQPLEAKLFESKVDSVFQLARREAYMTGIFWGASGLTGNLAMLCLLGYGGHLVSIQEITVGDLTSYVGGSVSGLTGFFTGLMRGVGAGSRVFWLLDRTSNIPLDRGVRLAAERNGPIRFENVRFTYPSRKEVEVLKGVTMTIEPGTSVALVGKSSIQALISRFYDPDQGTVTFDGTDPILFAGTVHDNIAYGSPNVTREDVESAARSANCDFIWDLPQGFDTMTTSALDSTSENAVNAAIDDIIRRKNITVILAAHRLSSIARAERVVVLENGVVSEQGRYDVLLLVEQQSGEQRTGEQQRGEAPVME
ncbi:hypothetical protein IAU60_004901 [Kwoniella sp. DSM 27419]